ncbi:membrane protein insertase YidC [Seleniivibrio woodruffii]|uniref:membrane protein insertase YidC n=1 Tax=Seleniivibrio woodruffii TaxID=1078050 RepID=UPI0039E704EC
MNRNLILAFGLSALVLIAFQTFFAPKTQPAPQKSENTAETAKPQEPSVKLTVDNTPKVKEKVETFAVQTPMAKFVFNQNTGNVRSAEVLSYEGKPLKDIVFDSKTDDSLFITVPVVNSYKPQKTEDGENITVKFTGSQGDLVVEKTYVISKKSYLVTGKITVSNIGNKTLEVPVRMGLTGGIISALREDKYTFGGPLMYDGKKTRTEKAEKLDETVTYDKPMWVGYTSKYYLAAIATPFAKGEFIPRDKTADIYGDTSVQVNPASRQVIDFNMFVGPKEYDLLKDYGLKLEKSIDFGIFAFIAIPMLLFLKIIYGFVQNYGIAIILLTVVVKVLTLPLTHKSMVSMKKMGSLAPKMTELKEKYGADKEKLNQAMMELYKKEGVNPLGGCLPMVLQIPIFFALYKTLLLAIELQGAPFFGWIVDLSVKDPYYITPIIMGATMFIQQKMTPSSVQDPIQQKVFMLMPFIFTFMFLTFPAGLVVYWLTNNVLSIAQQYYINKKTA